MFNPCCCSTCTYFLDSFNRADSTSLGSDWTEVDGDWEISSNHIKAPGADAIVVWTGEMPTTDAMIVNAKISTRANGDKVRLIADYVDSDNYVCFEFEYVSSSLSILRIIDRVAGAETIDKDVNFPGSSPTTPILRMSLSGGMLLAYVDEGSGSNCTGLISTSRSFTSKKVGIGTGDAFTGGTLANWFRAETPGDLLYTEDSNGSHTGLPTKCRAALVMRPCATYDTVTVHAVNAGAHACGCAATLDGDYVADIWGFHCPSSNALVVSEVYWRYAFGGTTCAFDYIFARTFTDAFQIFGDVTMKAENVFYGEFAPYSLWRLDEHVVCGDLINGTGYGGNSGGCRMIEGTTIDFP